MIKMNKKSIILIVLLFSLIFTTITVGLNQQQIGITTQNENRFYEYEYNENQIIRLVKQRFYHFLISLQQLIENEIIRSMIDRIIDRFTVNNDSRSYGIISQTHIPTTHIAIYKTDHLENNSLVYPGEYLNYTIEIKNIGPTDITTNMVVNDYLPIEVEYVGSSSSDVIYNSEYHFTYINYNSLNSNESRSFIITVQVCEDVQNPTMITNTAKVTTQGFSNETSVRTAIGPYTFSPLLIEKDDGTENGWVTHPTPSNPMVFINYSITVTNQHPLDVHNITIFDKLPDQLIFESASHGAITENTNVYWHLYSLQANSSKTLWINVSLNQSVEPGSEVENKVFVTSAETGSDQGIDTIVTKIFEGNPPTTVLSIGTPHYEKNGTIFVTNDTPITISASDNETYWTGVTNLTYEIYNEDQLVKKITVEDNDDLDEDPRTGFVNITFTLENQCSNLIRYYACDHFNTEEPNEKVFVVINTPPTLNLTILEPKISCYYEIDGVCYPVVSPYTPISIETSCTHTCEEYVDLNTLTIELYHGQNHGSWELVETLTIFDNDDQDIDNNNDIIKVIIHLEESCWYQIHYWSEDKLGNRNPSQGHVKSIGIFVDAQAPQSSYWFTGPQYQDSFHWITNETVLHVESTDNGCTGQGVGVHQTEWWLKKKQGDSWQETHRETIFDNDENDLDDTIGSTYIHIQIYDDGQHEIFYQSTDLLSNTQATQKRQVRVDSKHPISTLSIGQPNCSYDEDDETIFCVRTDTPIQINTMDLPIGCAVGIDYLEYEIYRNNQLLFSERVYGITQVSFTFENECTHTLRYRAVDLLGNEEPWNDQVFKVDDKKPSITLTVHDPSVYTDHNNPHYYVRTNTTIELDGQNHGSCPHWMMRYRINNADWHDVDTENLPHTFSFPYECQYTLEIEASDCIGNTKRLVKRFYVDDTPPTFRVIKPHNGIFEPGETFHVTIFAKDTSVFPPPCYQNHAVGIPDQSKGEAWIIDIYPEFKVCQLEIDYLYYQENSFEYNGYVTIPNDCSIPDGSAYFVGGAFDALNNGKHSVKNKIDEYYHKYGPESNQFTTLIAQLKQDEHIVEIVMDSDPPSGQDSEPPIVKIVQPIHGEDIHEDTTTIIINATDDVTETKNLTVNVEITVPGYRHFLKTAYYDEQTGYFSVTFDNHRIKNNTEIRIQAYATDSDDKTGISLPVFYTVKNMVYFAVWLNHGWNLIDFGSIQGNRSVPNVFQSVDHEYHIIFELGTGLYYIGGQSFNTLEEITPGQKYWVKMKEASGFYLNQTQD